MFLRTAVLMSALVLAVSAVLLISCDSKDDLYQAEKELFRARKMRHDLSTTALQGEFIDRVIESYRGIVQRYGGDTARTASLDTVIVTAQIEMAQLEFQAGMLEEAYRDFQDAVTIASNIPSARANAIYSAAVVAGRIGDTESSLAHYSDFYEKFLSPEARPFEIRMNHRYILAPVEAGHLSLQMGERDRAMSWYSAAEELYREIVESGEYQPLKEEAKLNLITVMLQKEEWKRAREYLRSLEEEGFGGERMPALLYLEARIELNGFDNSRRAAEILRKIAEEYPESDEASSALVTAAGISFRKGNFSEAKKICLKIISEYGGRSSEVAEATWMLAEIEEKNGNWLEASLHYRALYNDHPYTLQGLEAPLRIAAHFDGAGEADVAAGAYERAREHYQKIATDSKSIGARIMAEKYIVRALTEEGKWEEAVKELIKLVDSYPEYRLFRGNYLRAASICEEKLNDPERAAGILGECIERYPGTSIASEAEKQLNRIRRGK